MYGGCKNMGFDVIEWVCKMVEFGVGEILFMSMDCDGMKLGFDFVFMCGVLDVVLVLVIVLGGVGLLQYLVDGIKDGCVDVVLVVSIFYYGEYMVGEVKCFMFDQGIVVRL